MAKAPAILGGTPQQQRKFVIDCWNGMMDDITETVAQYPDAVHWRDPDTANTGLTFAAAHGSHKYDVAVFLINSGADIDAQNNEGMTALMFGAKGGSESYVELFLARGADESLRNKEGKTAEDIAIDSGRPSVAGEFEKNRRHIARAAEEEIRRARDEKKKALRESIAIICEGTRSDIVLPPAPTIRQRAPRA
jgi:hypothetical protein